MRTDPEAISPTAHDSLFVGPGYEEQHRWWSVDEIAQSSDVFAPRRLADAVRELQQQGVPTQPVDVGV